MIGPFSLGTARRDPAPGTRLVRFALAVVPGFVAFVLVLGDAAHLLAQASSPPSAHTSLAGPRFGVTYLSPGVQERARDRGMDVSPVITQFGWQFERQFDLGSDGLVTVSEWVLLAGGLEQGIVIPSVSWIVGLRTAGGSEFGVGPNLTPAGVALAVAGGVTHRAGNVNLPLNLALVPSSSGVRVSFIAGLNTRR